MQKQEVKRQEVEELLGFAITDEQLQEALECARRKQEYIYQRERRPVVLQHWYLVKLPCKYAKAEKGRKWRLSNGIIMEPAYTI